MAILSQTVSNDLTILGSSPPNLWGVMVWGDEWGASEDVAVSFDKGIGFGAVVMSDSISKSFNVTLYETVNLTYALDICKRYEKWCLVWTSPTTNGADAVYDNFTKI